MGRENSEPPSAQPPVLSSWRPKKNIYAEMVAVFLADLNELSQRPFQDYNYDK